MICVKMIHWELKSKPHSPTVGFAVGRLTGYGAVGLDATADALLQQVRADVRLGSGEELTMNNAIWERKHEDLVSGPVMMQPTCTIFLLVKKIDVN